MTNCDHTAKDHDTERL